MKDPLELQKIVGRGRNKEVKSALKKRKTEKAFCSHCVDYLPALLSEMQCITAQYIMCIPQVNIPEHISLYSSYFLLPDCLARSSTNLATEDSSQDFEEGWCNVMYVIVRAVPDILIAYCWSIA